VGSSPPPVNELHEQIVSPYLPLTLAPSVDLGQRVRRILFRWKVAMFCQEYLRLRQHFESALRHYGRVLLSSRDNELVGTAAQQAAEIRKKAFEERDAAKQRLHLHGLVRSANITAAIRTCLVSGH